MQTKSATAAEAVLGDLNFAAAEPVP